MKEELMNWVTKAKKNLHTAKYLLEGNQLEDCAFYCQQSVEKALKSLHLLKFEDIVKIHDLTKLARKLGLPEELIEYCIQLTPVYFTARYPDVENIPTKTYIKKDCEEFIQYTEKILKWIESKISLGK